jgi:adenylate cyclase
VPITQQSLAQGVYGKYFKPEFLNEFHDMSPEKLKKTFSHFINVFQKLERLINANSSMAFDGNAYGSLEKLLNDAANMLQVEEVLLYKVDEETGEMSQLFLGENEIFAAGTGIAGYCVKAKQMLVLKNPKIHPQFVPEIDYPYPNGSAHSMMTLPISAGGNIITGVLIAINKRGPGPEFAPLPFDQEDEYMFKCLGFTTGAILSNSKVYESMNNTQKKVTVLLETTRSLASILDLDKLIKVIMDSAKELLSSDRCTLFLHDPERKQLRAIIQGRDSVQEIRIPSNAGIAGAVFTSGIPINIHDAYKDSRFNPEVDKQTGYVTKTILCMPIKNILGECIGVTQMINKQRGVYSAEDEMILSSFSSQAAVAIEKSQLFKKTEDMRIYLQSILSSITSCVITLSESMKLNTINRPWFNNALGIDESYMKEFPIEKWIGEENKDLLKDIKQVYQSGEAIYVTDFEIKGKASNVIVNYQVMPLIGSSGIVIVLDDISSEKRAVMTLGRYMSPALAKQVMEEGSGQLGGKRKKVSILFSDIRSFTTISEGMDPPEVVELLNHHFTDAVNAITEEQGILDKFIGILD